MISTSLLIAIIGVSGTITASVIGAYINMRRTKIKQDNLNKRTVADYYMGEKIEQLMLLYSLLNNVSGGFVGFVLRNQHDREYGIDPERFEQYVSDVDEFSHASDRCRIFLNEEQNDLLTKNSLIYHIAINCAYEEDGLIKINWEQLENEVRDDWETEAFREHARLALEMLDDEVNRHVDELY